MTYLTIAYILGILMGSLATWKVYRDYKTEAAPRWLTIPFMFFFAALTILIVLTLPLSL